MQESNVKIARLTIDAAKSAGEDGMSRGKTFAEMVDPVVMEYERSMEVLEGELQRLQAAWVRALATSPRAAS